ncbi:MAG TPA: hypothetical protein VEK07_20170 [Polyangiaceae bacterium]|nr:hypothetical protein [Polyangiaceae bacterium]
MIGGRAAAALVGSIVCGCAKVDPAPVAAQGPSDPPRSAAVDGELVPVDPADLTVTSGAITRQASTTFAVRSGGMRAELGVDPRDAVRIDFVYLGPTRVPAPLASGELRRQIGLKLRASNTCNVVYAMWHIEPSRGIEVSVKSNAGQRLHGECGDRGYVFVKPTSARPVADIRVGERHSLAAAIVGDELRVVADDVPSWVGKLPPAAFAFDGPVGVRTDNGDFDVRMAALAPSRTAADRAADRRR